MGDTSQRLDEPGSLNLLVTGVGRSGTGYVARLLTEAGVACSHEGLFDGRPVDDALRQARRRDGLRLAPVGGAESSWYAAPASRELEEDGVMVVHLLRHPIAWLASWAHTVFEPTRQNDRTMAFLNRVARDHPPAGREGWREHAQRDPVDASMRLWPWYNDLVESTHALALERFSTHYLAGLLRQKGTREVMEVSRTRAHDAMAAVPRDVNARAHPAIDWERVRHKPHAECFLQSAYWWKYRIDAPWELPGL